MLNNYDKIIIGAGLYGLYSALFCAKRNERVLVLEYENSSFMRATHINQARVHMGYHYPRSLSTAIKSASYFERFHKDYEFCIHSEFENIYAISSNFSYTSSEQFIKFCKEANMYYEEVNPLKYFKEMMCEGAFITKEYTYDVKILKDYLVSEINKYSNISIHYYARIKDVISVCP